MTQKFMHLMAPEDQLAALQQRLTRDKFQVGPSKRTAGGIVVRVREDSGDEREVQRIAGQLAPSARYGPPGAPTQDIPHYREGLTPGR